MLANNQTSERISCYCALCISRCGATAVVENGRFTALEPDTACLAHSVDTLVAMKRGERLIVVDPRRAGLANKADARLQVPLIIIRSVQTART